MLNRAQVEHWPGRSMIDRSGTPLGTIRAVFADPAGHPAWATVRSGGRLSRKIRFVPISDAEQVPTGVAVPFTAAQVEGAPDADRNGNLSAGERRALHAHYGLRDDATLPAPDPGRSRGPDASMSSESRGDAPGAGGARRDAPKTGGSRGDAPPEDRAADDASSAAGRPRGDAGPAGRDADRPEPAPGASSDRGAATPPAFPAPAGPGDLDALPEFDPDSPAVGDPEDPRFDPPGGRKAPRRRGPGTPDEDLLGPPADDHGPFAAAGPAEDPLLSDDTEPPDPGPRTPRDGPGTGDPADRVVGDPSDPRGGDPGDDPVFPADLPDFPDAGDDPDGRG